VCLFCRSLAVASDWIQIRYYGMYARFVSQKQTLVLRLLCIGAGGAPCNAVLQEG
jgi:hypothetical protein